MLLSRAALACARKDLLDNGPCTELNLTPRQRSERDVAHGRLFVMRNMVTGFRVDSASSFMLSKHRSRARTLWGDGCNKPEGGNGGGTDEAARRAAKDIADLRAKQDRLRGKGDLITRLAASQKASGWASKINAEVPSARLGGDTPPPEQTLALRRAWPAAAHPSRRSMVPYTRHPKEINDALRKALPPRDDIPPAKTALPPRGDIPPAKHDGAHDNPLGRADGPVNSQGNSDCDERGDPAWAKLQSISEEQYERDAAAWNALKRSGGPAGDPPLNVQQRSAARQFMRYVVLRKRLADEGRSASHIERAARSEGLSSVLLVMGAGGTGKSAVLKVIGQMLHDRGVPLLISAYTGVAAAPFKGPTLLSLFNMGIDRAVNAGTMAGKKRLEARAKFFDESGVTIEQMGALGIDEVSFNDAQLMGHISSILQQLTGNLDVAFGGVPVILLGDNKQKPPPGGVPWYKELVLRAENKGLLKGDLPTTARAKGLALLADAPKVKLVRLMRVEEGQQPFVDHMLYMRRTDVPQPVTDEFIKQLRPVGPTDGPEWWFAPIGVLSQFERDALNYKQVYEFAKRFGLVLVRWKLTVKHLTELPVDAAELEAIQSEEAEGLWGYFCEGAPVLLTENIKSVRALVNGTPGLLDSLSFVDNAIPANYIDAEREGGFSEVTLTEPPYSVNVRVGGGVWHGIDLDDLSDVIHSTTDDAQVIPILVSNNTEDVRLHGLTAARLNVAVVKVKLHQFALAFAMTDFKLQGRTLPRLILSICERPMPPYMTLAGFYVLISRVRTLDGLRLLWKDSLALLRMTNLQWAEELYAWENGYDSRGRWSDELAVEALTKTRNVRASANISKVANAKKKTPPGKAPSGPPQATPPRRPLSCITNTGEGRKRDNADNAGNSNKRQPPTGTGDSGAPSEATPLMQ